MTLRPRLLTLVLSSLSLLGFIPQPASLLAADETYQLAYKFTAGEEFRTQVVQLATVETKIKGVSQTARSRSVSTKVWKITKVDGQGNITFENSVSDVDMWQSVSGKDEVTFNSLTDKTPPPGYKYVADTIGKPLATITISPAGKVIDRQSELPEHNLGLGDATIPLPTEAVKIGATWSTPEEVRVKTDEGLVKKIQTRQVFQLQKVETGVATISVNTQILTPVSDPKIQSQLVQRLQKGTIKFDLDAGRLIRKQMDLDESVLGFNGPDSHMLYLSRTTEEPLKDQTAAIKTATTAR